MFLFLKRYSKTLLDLSILIGIIIFIMWIGEIVFDIATPLVFAYFIFLMMEPITKFFVRKGLKRSVATILSLFIILLIVFGFVFILGVVFLTQLEMIVRNSSKYFINFEEYVTDNITILRGYIDDLPPDIIDNVNNSISSLSSSLLNYTTRFLKGAVGSVSSVSIMSVKIVVGIILAFFLSVEKDDIKRFINHGSPKTFKETYYFLKTNVFSQLGKYVKAQLKLISITFVIVFITLLFLRIENAFTIAFISAIFDILPLLGVSSIFIPWILYVLLIKGSTLLAIELGILLLVVIAFRQIAEPKILGDSLGVSAFFMLSSMTVFLAIFGMAGFILTPILIILIKELYKNGYLSKWIRKPEGEY